MKKFFEILKKIIRIAAVFILSVIVIIVIVCSIKSAIYRAEGFKFSSELKQYDNFADNAFLLNDDIIVANLQNFIRFYDTKTLDLEPAKNILKINGDINRKIEKYDDNKIAVYEQIPKKNQKDNKYKYNYVIKIIDVPTGKECFQSPLIDAEFIKYIGNDKFVIVHKIHGTNNYYFEIYDLRTNKFVKDKILTLDKRIDISDIEKINDDKIFILGRYSNCYLFAKVYDLKEKKLSDVKVPKEKVGFENSPIRRIAEDKFLISYHVGNTISKTSFLIVNTKDLTSQKLKIFKDDKTRIMNCQKLNDERLLLYGLETDRKFGIVTSFRNIYLYDIKTGTLKHGNKKLQKGRFATHTFFAPPSVLLPDGRVAIFGGDINLWDLFFSSNSNGLSNPTIEIIKIEE